jgi:hypothetical protein
MSEAPAVIVFLGPSVRREEIAGILPGARILPPVARDDLYRAREQGGSIFLIIDGVFTHQLAISPREVVDVARDGALVFGAASMGALRGAECWPVGMRGVGVITRLYRLGWLDSDDEVAVATNPDDEFAAVSLALVNVRYAISKALRRGLVDRETAHTIVRTAQELFFPERHWPTILKRAGLGDRAVSLERFCRDFDLKKQDALHAARVLADVLRRHPGLVKDHARRDARPFTRPERYPGHDRFLGVEPGEFAVELVRWLFGTGRYQAHVWPLVSGEPELREVIETVEDPDQRTEARREALAGILARRLADVESLAPALWAELEFMDELDAELMRWYATRTMAASAPSEPHLDVLRRVRDEVAIAHGLLDWAMLREEVVAGRLFDAIPLTWIDDACSLLARARSWAQRAAG